MSTTSPHPGRRAVLGATALSTLLTACSPDSGTAVEEPAASADGSWSFTDDRKVKTSLDSVPQRIVAFTGTAAALHDFGIDDQIVGVFGPTKLQNGKADPQAGNIDVDKVTILGNAYDKFNVEKYAGLTPDLLITNMYEPDTLWFVPEDSADKIAKLAKSVAITSSRVPLVKIIERSAALTPGQAAGVQPTPPPVYAPTGHAAPPSTYGYRRRDDDDDDDWDDDDRRRYAQPGYGQQGYGQQQYGQEGQQYGERQG